jgi:diguanylate cyclase (GGDEF)-like protein
MKKMVPRGEEMYSSDVFQILFEYEISRCKRYPTPLALLEIEMKPSIINEELQGNAASIFASALNSHLRSVDIASKAGNVFMVLLPTSDEQGAIAVCDRLLSVFKNKIDSPDGSSIAFSIQIGATAHKGGPDISGDDILQKAGDALKQSKLKGPNTYVLLS